MQQRSMRLAKRSSAPSMKQIPGRAPKLGNFVGYAGANQVAGAVARCTEARGDLECGSISQRPGDGRRNIMRSSPETEVPVCSKPPIHLDADLKILRTEIAPLGSRFARERAADPNGVAELERRMPDVLLGNEVLGNRPALVIAAEDQLCFNLPLFLKPRLAVGRCQIIVAIVIHDLEQTLVRPIDVLELDVEDRIDPMLAREEPEAILPPVAGKDRALPSRGLAVKVELACPPCGRLPRASDILRDPKLPRHVSRLR